MPEGRNIVVSDTTPFIALSIVGQLQLLAELYEEIFVPPSVFDEVMAGGVANIGVADFRMAEWIRVVELVDPRRADLLVDLDRGEAETITLAQEVGADLVIIDERLGRRFARHLGLAVTGSLGVLLRAKQMGYVNKVGPMVEALRHGGIRLGDDVVQRTLELAKELD